MEPTSRRNVSLHNILCKTEYAPSAYVWAGHLNLCCMCVCVCVSAAVASITMTAAAEAYRHLILCLPFSIYLYRTYFYLLFVVLFHHKFTIISIISPNIVCTYVSEWVFVPFSAEQVSFRVFVIVDSFVFGTLYTEKALDTIQILSLCSRPDIREALKKESFRLFSLFIILLNFHSRCRFLTIVFRWPFYNSRWSETPSQREVFSVVLNVYSKVAARFVAKTLWLE